MAFKHLSETGVYRLSLTSEDEKYFYIEIRAMKPGVNRNNWDFTLDGIKAHGDTFINQPILIAYNGDRIGEGHNFDMTLNRKTGKYEADFRNADAERIVGEVTASRVEEQTGETWLILSARIWKYYAQQLVAHILEVKAMDVSVEVEVAEDYEIRDDGVEVFDNWTGLGVTILGEGVNPAIEGARLRALSMSDEYKRMRILAASYVPQSTNSKTGGLRVMNEAMKKMLADAMKEFGVIVGFSADGKYASVLRTNGIPALYPVDSFNEKDGVVQSHFVNAAITFSANIAGEDGANETITCTAEDLITVKNAELEAANEKCEQAESDCKAAKDECAKANARIEELENAEKERNLAAMTSAFDSAVSAHNNSVDSKEAITEEDMNVIHNSINEGKYANVDEVIGEFKKLAYDKHQAANKKEDKRFAWNSFAGNQSATGEDAIIAKFGGAQ